MNLSSLKSTTTPNVTAMITILPVGGSISLFCCLIIGLGLHILGISCCFKERRKLRKQKIILLNLSVVEMLTIFHSMLHLAASYVPWSHDQTTVANDVLVTSYHIVTSLFYCSMILIAMDRLVCILSPTKHYVHIRRSTLKKIVVFIWCSSILVSISLSSGPVGIDTRAQIILYSSYTAQGVFLTISTLAYSLVALSVVRRSSLGVVISTKRTTKPHKMKRTFFVSFSLVITFIVFYMIPNYVTTRDGTVEFIMIAATYFGLSVDPILYILLHNALRKSALKTLKCVCCTVPTHSLDSIRTIRWSIGETFNSTFRRKRSSRTSLASTINNNKNNDYNNNNNNNNFISKTFATISATVTIKVHGDIRFNSVPISDHITVEATTATTNVTTDATTDATADATALTSVTHLEITPVVNIYKKSVILHRMRSKETSV